MAALAVARQERLIGLSWSVCRVRLEQTLNSEPTFEDAEKAFNATFGRVKPKLDQQTRQMQMSTAIENKLSRANTMHSLFGPTPSHSKALEQPQPRQCSSPLRGSQRFDPQRSTA
eukprot:scaffold19007_cov71-Phaeocystis_antarctica.AAC.6